MPQKHTNFARGLRRFFALSCLLVFLAPHILAQERFYQDSRRAMAQTDALDVLGLRATGTTKTALAKAGDMVLVPGPYFGVNPTAGTILGLGANALFYLGDPETTLLSTIDNLIAITSKDQFMFYSKSTVFTADRDWEFMGDLRYYIYSQPTYGLGTRDNVPVQEGFNFIGGFTQPLPGAQDIKYKHFRFHETAFRKLAGDYYAGIGYKLDYHYEIEDLALDLGQSPAAISSHYAYSLQYGFDPKEYVSSAVTLNLLVESRDHVLNPHRVQFLHLSYDINLKALGSSQCSQIFRGEYRAYIPLAEDQPRHLIGFWAFVNILTSGSLPYLDLPASGHDVRERSGRGYAQGRWRGQDQAYVETEYRFPLGWNGLLGGVVFANAVSTSRHAAENAALGYSDPGVGLFEYIKPAAGVGLRLLMVKDIRLTIELDYAQGVDGSNGIYINLYEIF